MKGARLLSLKMEEVPFENNLRNCKRKMCTGALVVGPREIASTFIFFILLFIVFFTLYRFLFFSLAARVRLFNVQFNYHKDDGIARENI